jgi:transcriptional regulator with XRE-family HTH domain
MARRAAEGSVKSPVNIVVGILLKRLRERSDKQLDQIASAFNVSPAYLAAIEAGTNAVPAKSVAGLGSLGVDFVAASALLTLISYLDCRIRNSRIYDFREVQLRAEGLLSQTGALAFQSFLEWTVATIQVNETADRLDSQRGLELLEFSLQKLSQLKLLEPTTSNAELASRHKLSPMVEDLLDIGNCSPPGGHRAFWITAAAILTDL